MIKVFSKIELSKKLQEKVLVFIKSKENCENCKLSEIEFVVDPKILAGIRIDINSEIIDLTLNQRIDEIVKVILP